MSNILKRVRDNLSQFRPTKPTEYLALQLARKLNDQTSFRHYLALFERYPEGTLLQVYRRSVKKQEPTGERFMAEFEQLTN